MIVCILIPGFMIVGILIVTQDDNFREVQSFPQRQLRSRQSKSLGLQGMLLLLSKLTCTLLTFPSSWILTIYLLREGRVRSLHTLYTLCDTLSPHPPLVMMLILMMMLMLMLMGYFLPLFTWLWLPFG